MVTTLLTPVLLGLPHLLRAYEKFYQRLGVPIDITIHGAIHTSCTVTFVMILTSDLPSDWLSDD